LKLDLPGQKWVAGEGPLALKLLHNYPSVRYLGVLTQDALAELYSQADVFVFPSVTDTFGLAMLEALACGVPVAAFPVAGPLGVIGESCAGVLDENLHRACIKALRLSRFSAVARAKSFSWETATQSMIDTLVWLKNPSPDEIFNQASKRLDTISVKSVYSPDVVGSR
jgi:glycosyltransferase involved in cell wall biosynthesis